jgi:23S rRNA pseudouridine2605 synthase
MAAAGVGSRRRCEELITAGRVEVDHKVVTELGTKVDPEKQEIRLDGAPITRSKLVYYLVNKPMGVVSTNYDPAGRPRVIDLLPPAQERLFTVGRLDLSSEGLILVTNDGELANQLAHPRYGVEKTYHVLVAGKPEPDVLEKLRTGVHLAEGFAKAVSATVRTEFKQSTMLEIVLNEGKNREIRRLLAKVGHKVMRLKRVALGPVRLRDMEAGGFRPVRGEELKLLRAASQPKARTGRPKRPPRPATVAPEAPGKSVAKASERKPDRPKPSQPRSRTTAKPRAQGRPAAGRFRPTAGKGRPA